MEQCRIIWRICRSLWLFLMTNNGGTPFTQLLEWPSLCFDYRDNFGFAPRATESGEWPDLHTLGWLCRKMNLIRNWCCAIGKAPTVHDDRRSVVKSGPRRAQFDTDSSLLIVCSSWHTWDPGRVCIRTTLHAACTSWGAGLQCSTARVGRVSETILHSVTKKLAQSAWFVICQRAMSGSVTSSTFSSEVSFKYHEHNTRNPMLASLCHFVVGVVMEALLVEMEVGRIALTWNFSLPVVNDHVFVRNWPLLLPQHVETDSADSILGTSMEEDLDR